eukprot:1426003-Prymnesium_polylepis.1
MPAKPSWRQEWYNSTTTAASAPLVKRFTARAAEKRSEDSDGPLFQSVPLSKSMTRFQSQPIRPSLGRAGVTRRSSPTLRSPGFIATGGRQPPRITASRVRRGAQKRADRSRCTQSSACSRTTRTCCQAPAGSTPPAPPSACWAHSGRGCTSQRKRQHRPSPSCANDASAAAAPPPLCAACAPPDLVPLPPPTRRRPVWRPRRPQTRSAHRTISCRWPRHRGICDELPAQLLARNDRLRVKLLKLLPIRQRPHVLPGRCRGQHRLGAGQRSIAQPEPTQEHLVSQVDGGEDYLGVQVARGAGGRRSRLRPRLLRRPIPKRRQLLGFPELQAALEHALHERLLRWP